MQDVLTFWFEELTPQQWFKKDPVVDGQIRERFLSTYEQAKQGELDSWKETPDGTLALILVLDQFSRNLFREGPNAFAYDEMCRTIVKDAMEKGFDAQVTRGRAFFYLPLMHSEELADQQECVRIFSELAEQDESYTINKEFAIKHLVIIERFERFPHRNEMLGRESTPEELEFLKEPGSSF